MRSRTKRDLGLRKTRDSFRINRSFGSRRKGTTGARWETAEARTGVTLSLRSKPREGETSVKLPRGFARPGVSNKAVLPLAPIHEAVSESVRSLQGVDCATIGRAPEVSPLVGETRTEIRQRGGQLPQKQVDHMRCIPLSVRRFAPHRLSLQGRGIQNGPRLREMCRTASRQDTLKGGH